MNELTKTVADLDENEALRITRAKLEKGEDPHLILEESRNGMELVGKRFSEQEYFLPELIFSAEIFKGITEIVKPKLKGPVSIYPLKTINANGKQKIRNIASSNLSPNTDAVALPKPKPFLFSK